MNRIKALQTACWAMQIKGPAGVLVATLDKVEPMGDYRRN